MTASAPHQRRDGDTEEVQAPLAQGPTHDIGVRGVHVSSPASVRHRVGEAGSDQNTKRRPSWISRPEASVRLRVTWPNVPLPNVVSGWSHTL